MKPLSKPTSQKNQPPVLALRILNLSVPASIRQHLIGDLTEEFITERLPEAGVTIANLWFWKQTLLSTYEFMNKQHGGIMAFIFSILVLVAVLVIAMMLGGELSMFFNLPSVMIIIPPALVFGISVTSFASMKMCIKLCVSEQPEVSEREVCLAMKFARVTGNSAIYMGIISIFIGAISMASNIKADVFHDIIGPATAVCLLGIFYASILKTVCYLAEQKIEAHSLFD